MLGRFFRKRWVRIAAVSCVLLGGVGVWLLLHPAGLWLQPWRPEPTMVASRFIFGPYPLEEDFVVLKRQGVTTIITLLDSDLPYEAVLLSQERELADKYGMEVRNFPMASILGQSFGKDYLVNSRAAAEAAIASKGVAYIHCYLGLHRAANVRKILETHATATVSMHAGTLQHGRDEQTLVLDRANIAFLEGNHAQSLDELASLKVKGYAALVLEAWSHYRLNRIDDARSAFSKALMEQPEGVDALGGLGYCALRSGDVKEAASRFDQALALRPDDAQAIEGLGYVRIRQGRREEARTLLQRVLDAHPEHDEVRATLEGL